MTEMVERVATVINRAGICDWRIETCRAGICQCKELARAAIDAMREPTEAMYEAGEHYLERGHFESVPVDGVWQAMTDAALK